MAENQNIEYKESWRDEYLKWICGFANAQGGRIYIGIADNQQVVGVSNSHRLLEDIPNKIVTTLGIVCDVNLLEREGKEIIEIVVEPSNMPIAYKGEYHIRSGATKQQLRGVALQQFILKKMGLSWDEIPTEVGIDKIDRIAIEYFLRKGIFHKRLSSEAINYTTEEVLQNHDERPTSSFLYNLVMDTYSFGYNNLSYVDMPVSHIRIPIRMLIIRIMPNFFTFVRNSMNTITPQRGIRTEYVGMNIGIKPSMASAMIMTK